MSLKRSAMRGSRGNRTLNTYGLETRGLRLLISAHRCSTLLVISRVFLVVAENVIGWAEHSDQVKCVGRKCVGRQGIEP